MDIWEYIFIKLGVHILLILGIIVSIIFFAFCCIKKRKKKPAVFALFTFLLLYLTALLFFSSHKTWYQFNDWYIIGQDIRTIEKKYGAFDLGCIMEGKSHWAAYYIYTDNGFIMPDHLEHYYYMEYDETGIIYEVYDDIRPGG